MSCRKGSKIWQEKLGECEELFRLLEAYMQKKGFTCKLTESSVLDHYLEFEIFDDEKPVAWIEYDLHSDEIGEEPSIYIGDVHSTVPGIGLGNLLICLALCLNPDPVNLRYITLTAAPGMGTAQGKRRGDPENLFKYYESLGFERVVDDDWDPGLSPIFALTRDYRAKIEDLFIKGCTAKLKAKFRKALK